MLEYGPTFGERTDELDKVYKALKIYVSTIINMFPFGAFVRLGSRSPKDSHYGYQHGFRCLTAKHVFALLFDSERVYEDLTYSLETGVQINLWLRQWTEIPNWSEFRCFVRKGALVGISQYSYLQQRTGDKMSYVEFPYYEDWYARIINAIFLFSGQLGLAMTLDSYVFDISFKVGEQPLLIEFNPWGRVTDPCLFDWTWLENATVNAPILRLRTQTGGIEEYSEPPILIAE